MSDFDGVLNLQVDAVVGALRAHREQRCRELLRDAEYRAHALQTESRQQLRARVSEAIAEERKRRAVALREAANRIRAAQRRSTQAFYENLLAEAWPGLIAELEARWADTESRRAWCRMLVADAASRLGSRTWTIEHAAAWSASDSAWLSELLADHDHPEAALEVDADLRAGLRIREQSSCLDGSIDGLLRSRGAIEGQLLAAWERLRGMNSGEPR